MEFKSILDLRENPKKDKERPAFYRDLNIYTIIESISREWGEKLEGLFGYLPADEECERYRREVFSDVKRKGVYDALLAFTEGMKGVRETTVKKEAVDSRWQKAIWHVCEAGEYCRTVCALGEKLFTLPLESAGLISLRDDLKAYLASAKFAELRKTADRLYEELESFHLVMTYENDRVTIAQEEPHNSYTTFLQQYFPGQERELKNPFSAMPEMSELEEELMKLFNKQRPDFFREAEDFFRKYKEYIRPEFVRLAAELRFYLSFCRFERRMQERGYYFSVPGRENGSKMEAEGLYDLALACARISEGNPEKVVANDFSLEEGEQFFVLTGPNQGGKTTFARSLGQLAFFAALGLDVPARAANVPAFSKLLTHFSVEESVETGRGKLKEELVRLAPMMEQDCRGAFVIINELFTTAANYDARIMGKRVIDHFLAMDCKGIYVTHLQELAEVRPGVVSLKADVDEAGNRTFRIRRGEPAASADAMGQVRKHGLTYEQLTERLSMQMAETT